jgi:hypothetical protein
LQGGLSNKNAALLSQSGEEFGAGERIYTAISCREGKRPKN